MLNYKLVYSNLKLIGLKTMVQQINPETTIIYPDGDGYFIANKPIRCI
jgi:hypothetical protein